MKRLSVFIIFVGMALRAMAQGGEECNFSFAQLFTKDYTLGILSEDLSIISFHNTDINFLKSTSKKTKIITPPKLYDAFVMINYAYSIAPQSSIGFTMGMYETWGWYVSMAADIDSDFPEYSRSDEDGTSDYFFTGKKTLRVSRCKEG